MKLFIDETCMNSEDANRQLNYLLNPEIWDGQSTDVKPITVAFFMDKLENSISITMTQEITFISRRDHT